MEDRIIKLLNTLEIIRQDFHCHSFVDPEKKEKEIAIDDAIKELCRFHADPVVVKPPPFEISEELLEK